MLCFLDRGLGLGVFDLSGILSHKEVRACEFPLEASHHRSASGGGTEGEGGAINFLASLIVALPAGRSELFPSSKVKTAFLP